MSLLYVEGDQIYTLASPASPMHYQLNPVQTTKTSVHGAINMVGLAKRVNAKILQGSTSEVYGGQNAHPQPDTYRGLVILTVVFAFLFFWISTNLFNTVTGDYFPSAIGPAPSISAPGSDCSGST